jgi:hypothetical protein
MYALGLDEDDVEEHVYGLMGVSPVGNGIRKMAVAAE